MPLYEYKCMSCSETLEAIQKFADAPFTICPQCGGELKKLISSPAIQFKGSGFYITDYRKSAGGASDGSGSAGGANAKSEKPASPAGGASES